MPRREPRKLDAMPDTGRVAVGHPSQEADVVRIARDQLCDYVLSDLAPPGNAYIMNADQIFAPPLESLWWAPTEAPDGTMAPDLVERWNFGV